jgi:hypothetical protein
MKQHNMFGGIDDMSEQPVKKEKTKEEIVKIINSRITHIRTLGRGYGINDARIKELQFVLNLLNEV